MVNCCYGNTIVSGEGVFGLTGSFIVEEPEIYGCTDTTAFNYNVDSNTDDGSCIAAVNGCTNASAFNYNASANTDDGSCIAVVNGCTDANAFNYNAGANTDDGSCIAVVNGCTDANAFNYNSLANTDDGSCNSISLPQGWSMFGYTCLESIDIVEAFSGVPDKIEIVKDEWGLAYFKLGDLMLLII